MHSFLSVAAPFLEEQQTCFPALLALLFFFDFVISFLSKVIFSVYCCVLNQQLSVACVVKFHRSLHHIFKPISSLLLSPTVVTLETVSFSMLTWKSSFIRYLLKVDICPAGSASH